MAASAVHMGRGTAFSTFSSYIHHPLPDAPPTRRKRDTMPPNPDARSPADQECLDSVSRRQLMEYRNFVFAPGYVTLNAPCFIRRDIIHPSASAGARSEHHIMHSNLEPRSDGQTAHSIEFILETVLYIYFVVVHYPSSTILLRVGLLLFIPTEYPPPTFQFPTFDPLFDPALFGFTASEFNTLIPFPSDPALDELMSLWEGSGTFPQPDFDASAFDHLPLLPPPPPESPPPMALAGEQPEPGPSAPKSRRGPRQEVDVSLILPADSKRVRGPSELKQRMDGDEISDRVQKRANLVIPTLLAIVGRRLHHITLQDCSPHLAAAIDLQTCTTLKSVAFEGASTGAHILPFIQQLSSPHLECISFDLGVHINILREDATSTAWTQVEAVLAGPHFPCLKQLVVQFSLCGMWPDAYRAAIQRIAHPFEITRMTLRRHCMPSITASIVLSRLASPPTTRTCTRKPAMTRRTEEQHPRPHKSRTRRHHHAPRSGAVAPQKMSPLHRHRETHATRAHGPLPLKAAFSHHHHRSASTTLSPHTLDVPVLSTHLHVDETYPLPARPPTLRMSTISPSPLRAAQPHAPTPRPRKILAPRAHTPMTLTRPHPRRQRAASLHTIAASMRVPAASLLRFLTSMLLHLKCSHCWLKAQHKALTRGGCPIDAAFPLS
ncbi:hypothetical protein C8J57DRAFT_1539013 [Mycena rebaudengoi]|nr:hypothetical protein C8J57DRAFT_1539013 [Mycena rebaudengoi]